MRIALPTAPPVTVDDELYVRAYHGQDSKWYDAALTQKAGKIEAAGIIKKVRFEAVHGEIYQKIDEAYQKKYKESPYLPAMISERAKAATIKILPGSI